MYSIVINYSSNHGTNKCNGTLYYYDKFYFNIYISFFFAQGILFAPYPRGFTSGAGQLSHLSTLLYNRPNNKIRGNFQTEDSRFIISLPLAVDEGKLMKMGFLNRQPSQAGFTSISFLGYTYGLG